MRIKSSAIIVALVIGIVLTAIMFSVVAVMAQQSKLSAQERDGKIAYRAALSGIEDGLLRYKYATAQNKENEVYRDFTTGSTDGKNVEFLVQDQSNGTVPPTGPRSTYELSIRTDSLTIGSPDYLNSVNWYTDYQAALDQNAKPFLADNVYDFDLSYFINKAGTSKLSSLTMQFSDPFTQATPNSYTKLEGSNSFSAVSLQLIDASRQGEDQLLWETTNGDSSNHKIEIEGLDKCIGSSLCHLKVRPQVAKKSELSRFAARLFGSDGADVNAKYIFLKMFAKDNSTEGSIISATGQAGTVVIESIGRAGEAVHKLSARIDQSTGRYLGIFDYTLYCGETCQMPNINQPQ